MTGGAIDWTAAKLRLKAAEAELAHAFDIDGKRSDALLRDRARRLAADERKPTPGTESIRVLTANAGPERYALQLTQLVGVLPFTKCAPVAGGPPGLHGVINGRGAIWAVFDLRRLLGIDAPSAPDGGRVVLLRHSWRRVGLRVDEAADTRVLAAAAAQRSASGPQAAATFIRAVMPDGLILLDLDALWTHPSIGETR